MIAKDAILPKLPYAYPFLFVDAITAVDANTIKGTYTFCATLPFYQGHFVGHPVTPGVILTECCAQIGLVAFGVFLLDGKFSAKTTVAFTQSEMEFLKPVYPKEKVRVVSEKVYFRFYKLKCKVKMYNEKEELVCRGTLAGILKPNNET